MGGNKFDVISDRGMKSFFRRKSDKYLSLSSSAKLKIVGGYDSRYDEYIVSFQNLLASSLVNQSTGDSATLPPDDTDPTIPGGTGGTGTDNNPTIPTEPIPSDPTPIMFSPSPDEIEFLDTGKVVTEIPFGTRNEEIGRVVPPKENSLSGFKLSYEVDPRSKARSSKKLTGSVTSSTSSTALTGSGTAFETELNVGDTVRTPEGKIGEVSSITNNTTAVLTANGSNAFSGKVGYATDERGGMQVDSQALQIKRYKEGMMLFISFAQLINGNEFPLEIKIDIGGTLTTIPGTYDPVEETFTPGGDTYALVRDNIIASDTLAFSVVANKWTSFYSYAPDYMAKMNSRMFTFTAGNLYIHDENELRNVFYGMQYKCKVDFISNLSPNVNKAYHAIKLEGSHPWRVNDIITNLVESRAFNMGHPVIDTERGIFLDNGSTTNSIFGLGNISSTAGSTTITGVRTDGVTLKKGDIIKYDDGSILGIFDAYTGTVPDPITSGDVSISLQDNATVTLSNVFAYVQGSVNFIGETQTQTLQELLSSQDSINGTEFDEREGRYYAELKRADVANPNQKNNKGTNILGLGFITLTNASTTVTLTTAQDSVVRQGDIIRKDGGDLVGTVASVTNNTTIVLESAYPDASGTFFGYVERNNIAEGDKYKGYYARVNMENDTNEKAELYSASLSFTPIEKSTPSKRKST